MKRIIPIMGAKRFEQQHRNKEYTDLGHDDVSRSHSRSLLAFFFKHYLLIGRYLAYLLTLNICRIGVD